MRPIQIISAVFFSSVLAAVVLAIVFLSGASSLINVIVLFSAPLASILEHVIPDAFWYWAVNDGGSQAAILLFLISAWLQFALLFFLLSAWFLRRRSNIPIHRICAKSRAVR
jgi:hypothetical protein